ncbi:MAG: hypothetical protein ACK52V_16205 [Betaproteobacteria bacterium]
MNVAVERRLQELEATRAELLQLLGVSETTLTRWLTGKAEPPPHALALVALHVKGELGALRPAWSGWKLERDALADPWGRRYGPAEIGMIPHLWRLASTTAPAQSSLFPEPDRAEALRLLVQASSGSSRRR